MEKLLIIAGPTGVGKTSLSIELAKQFHGEIISGDSMQVYKKMNIGTAKIKEIEMQGVQHHLVDCYDLDEEYNVKIFQEKGRAICKDLKEQHILPIICGGTGLYIKSLVYDYQFIEQKQDIAFMEYLQTLSSDELWGLLSVIDKKTCDIIHHNNRQRVIRALCMAHEGNKKSDIVESQEHKPLYDAFIIGLTMDREHLYERINERVDQMMQEGLLEELKGLVEEYSDVWDYQSFQGIGYKEWKDYFNGESDIETCVELIKKNSRNFAKRQYTWFRNQLSMHWYDIEEANYKDKLLKDIDDWMKRG